VPEEFEYFLVIAKTRTLTFHDVELNDIAYANENAVPGFVKAHEEMLSKKRIASDEVRRHYVLLLLTLILRSDAASR
jgi:hypothetical protein